jgi:hypothetical protein
VAGGRSFPAGDVVAQEAGEGLAVLARPPGEGGLDRLPPGPVPLGQHPRPTPGQGEDAAPPVVRVAPRRTSPASTARATSRLARGWAAWTSGGRAASTPAGAAAYGDPLAGVSAHRRRVADGITAEEYQATVAVLHRMAANLGWADPGGGPGR